MTNPAQFISQVRAEAAKIVWPTRREVVTTTIMVFVMAGLFQRSFQTDADQTPWVGDLPVLGALFRSTRWKRSESELMIIVTPRLSTDADRAHEKMDAIPGKEPSALDLQLFGRASDKPLKPGDPTPESRR